MGRLKLIVAKDAHDLDLYYYFNKKYWFILSGVHYDVSFGNYTDINFYHLVSSEEEL